MKHIKVIEYKTPRQTTYVLVNGEVKAINTRVASPKEMIARASIRLNAQTQG